MTPAAALRGAMGAPWRCVLGGSLRSTHGNRSCPGPTPARLLAAPCAYENGRAPPPGFQSPAPLPGGGSGGGGMFYGTDTPKPLHQQPYHSPAPSPPQQQQQPLQRQGYAPSSPPPQHQQAAYAPATPASSSAGSRLANAGVRGGYLPAGGVGGAVTLNSLERVNPGRVINAVSLLGTVTAPHAEGRSCHATLLVPLASREGVHEIVVEAWDGNASVLSQLQGMQVLVEGRLRRDRQTGAVLVVVNSFKIVDATRPPAPVGEGGRRAKAEATSPRPKLVPSEVWRVHYETQTRTTQALAAHYNVKPDSVLSSLLEHAFKTQSPLRWDALAEEAGLAVVYDEAHPDRVSLQDYMRVADRYMRAQPPESIPTTRAGMPKVAPVRTWVLGLGKEDEDAYMLTEFEKQHGISMLYNALRMGVVAQATSGAWSPTSERPAAQA